MVSFKEYLKVKEELLNEDIDTWAALYLRKHPDTYDKDVDKMIQNLREAYKKEHPHEKNANAAIEEITPKLLNKIDIIDDIKAFNNDDNDDNDDDLEALSKECNEIVDKIEKNNNLPGLQWSDLADEQNPKDIKNILLFYVLCKRSNVQNKKNILGEKINEVYRKIRHGLFLGNSRIIGDKLLTKEAQDLITQRQNFLTLKKNFIDYLNKNEDRILQIVSGENPDAKDEPDPDPKQETESGAKSKKELDFEDANGAKDETPKKSEIVGANNVDYIAGSSLPVKELRNAIFDGDKKAAYAALDKWQEMVAKKIAELNEARNNKVEQNSKYLREEQEMLWEGIFQNIKDKRDLKYKKVHEFKDIYDRDESSDSTYEEKLKEIFDKASLKIGDICENINNYSISNRKREEYKSRTTTIISHLIDSTYSLLRNLKKNNSKEGFFNKRKIENAKEKERENEEYEKSFRGKDLNKKASIFAQNFADIFVAAFKINQVKNIDDIAKRQILDLIAESDGNVQDFIRLVNKSRVMSPNDGEATMFAINWLNNKGLKIPGNISNSDIDLTERNPEIRGIKEAFELIKQKIGTEVTPPYPDGVIANIVRSVENIANNKDQTTRQTLINNLLASKENKEYPNEVKIIANKFMVNLDNKSQDEKTNTNNQNNNPPRGLKNKAEAADQEIEDNNMKNLEGNEDYDATVTTAKCDGLPIGARRYSRAIRKRMNYALNKYM